MMLAGLIALAGCKGSTGDPGAQGPLGPSGPQGSVGPTGPQGSVGPTGPQGPTGPAGNDGMSAVAGPLNLVIDGVASTTANGSTTSTLTFTVYPAAVVCPGGVCNALTTLNQKTFYAAEYDAATRTFPRSFSFSGFTFQRLVDGGKGAQYTATKTAAAFAPEASASAFIYAYIATDPVIPPKGNYKLVDDVASAAKVYGTIDYTSAANVTGCEKCHVAPYSKHGYRQAHVTGLEDFVSCKACHTDQRAGGHRDWQLLVDDPATYAACSAAGTCATDAAHWADYAYTANVMNDTHMSHAMEFAYPQTIANCVACHAGNLAQVTSTANFKLATCKSCHPVTGVGGTDAKRAPALATILANASYNHAGIDLYTYPDSGAQTCAGCHPNKFAQVHGGFNTAVYAAEGSRYDAAVTTSIDSATFDSATNVVTATVSMTGLAANALVKPTVVVSLYGYDTKDFVLSGHGSISSAVDPVCPDAGGERGTANLEYTYGATQRVSSTNPCSGQRSTSARLQLEPAAPTAGTTTWTVTADLTMWAGKLARGEVSRVELAFLPAVGADQTAAIGTTNPAIAVGGAAKTISLAGTGAIVADADSYGKGIVSATKCNACHEALGTTFHSPNYGSAGVVGCRLCHTVNDGGSHLEMQSRSIDSYVHAIHSMQPFDVGSINFSDPVAAMHYEHHIESTYPSFSTLNCVSCHEGGTFEVPDQVRSLPSVLSASSTVAGRAISGIPSYVVGPASRACGSCHRAELINEDAMSTLVSFNAHTAAFGTLVVNGTGVLDAVTQDIMDQLGGPAFTGVAVAGTQVESCTICHATAGTQHQALFDSWRNDL